MSNLIKVELPSPITFNKICVGGILKTSKGWLPKLRTRPGNYQNIKDEVSQLTPEQATTVVIRAYYQQVGREKGWTAEEIDEHLRQGYDRHRELEQERLVAETQEEARRERERERSGKLQGIERQRVLNTQKWQIICIKYPESPRYKVEMNRFRGWKKLQAAACSLGLSQQNQRKWIFNSLDEANRFCTFVESHIEN